MRPVPGGSGVFPPLEQTQVKALACESPTQPGRPLARLSVEDVRQAAERHGIRMSYSTVWRLLDQDALRPWYRRGWLFPRDPLLLEKGSRVLDLYHRRWEGEPLGPQDCVVCADEISGLQALSRLHPELLPALGQTGRTEWE
jgi:hypothetical protein